MLDDATAGERALRTLPLLYSLALRLRDAGVAPDAIGEYLDVDPTALAGVYRIAEAKLAAARQRPANHRSQADDVPGTMSSKRSEIAVAHYLPTRTFGKTCSPGEPREPTRLPAIRPFTSRRGRTDR